MWFVDLAPVSRPSGVATAVCKALGLPARRGAAMEELERAVAGGLRGLIVVDNCEHVLDAAADVVATILRHSSSVVVLATSRQPLDVDGERVWPVHPLPVGVAAPAAPSICSCAAPPTPGSRSTPRRTPRWV